MRMRSPEPDREAGEGCEGLAELARFLGNEVAQGADRRPGHDGKTRAKCPLPGGPA